MRQYDNIMLELSSCATECHTLLIFLKISLIVRWVIFGILVLVAVSALMAYSHAKRRVAKGLPPKAYHRVMQSELAFIFEYRLRFFQWMVRQQQRRHSEPSLQNEFSFYRAAAPEYDLEALPPPGNHTMEACLKDQS